LVVASGGRIAPTGLGAGSNLRDIGRAITVGIQGLNGLENGEERWCRATRGVALLKG
jgi:hypothetical protein